MEAFQNPVRFVNLVGDILDSLQIWYAKTAIARLSQGDSSRSI